MSSQSQPNGEGRGPRKGHQSGTGPRTPAMFPDSGNTNRSIRLVPMSPYPDVPSVSSEYAMIMSPHTNQSSYVPSPYPNPASNIERSTTPFDCFEDSLLSNEIMYRNVSSVPSPAPITSNAQIRNSGLGSSHFLTGSTELLSVSENAGPSSSKKVKKSILPELSDQIISDVIALEDDILEASLTNEEQSQRNNERKRKIKTEGGSRISKTVVNFQRQRDNDMLNYQNQANTKKFRINVTSATGEVTEEILQSNKIPADQIKAEQSGGNDTLLNDDDISKANGDVVDTLFLKQTLEEMGKSMLNASYKIEPGMPINNVQRLAKLMNRIQQVWVIEWARVPQQPVSPESEPVTGFGCSAGINGNGNYASAHLPGNITGGNGGPPPSTSLNVMNGGQNYSRMATFPLQPQASPQPSMRSASTNLIAAPAFSSSSLIIDGLGSVHSLLGSSNQNGLQTGLQNLNSNFTFPVTSNVDHFRPKMIARVSQPNSVAQDQITFHAAPVTISQPQRSQQLPSLSIPLISRIGTQARRIQIVVGNTLFTLTEQDWAEVSESANQTKRINTLCDKLFTHQERLHCTVSGRKSKSGLPGLDPCKMLAIYACTAFLQKHPNQFPGGPIDSSIYKLSDIEKKKVKIIVSQKLNAMRQKQTRRQDSI